MYTHEIGPQEREKMTLTLKRKNTPPPERPVRVPSVFWELIAASQIKAIEIPMAPNIRGFRRPIRSRINTMNIRSTMSYQLKVYNPIEYSTYS